MSNPTISPTGRMDNPYVGPRAFRANEELYGREKEASALFNLLMAERIVLLYSPSGAGKTSLIQAKLVPQLQARRFCVLGPMRVGLERVTAADAVQASSGVNQYIASMLQSLEAQRPDAEQLGSSELAGLDLAGYLRQRVGKTAERIVLIFDQFEEILTVSPNDRDGKRAFFEQIGELLRETDDGQPVWALFSMREEYIAALEQYLRPIPTRLGNTLRIDRLNTDNAELAIQNPAAAKGIPFTRDALKQLVEDLSKEQVQLPDGTIETQIGAYIEPVQLQVVCYRLWNKLPENTTSITPSELSLLGKDISSALGDYYNDSVRSIAAKEGVSERELRRWIERKLITEQGIRSQALKGQENPRLEKAIATLVGAYLLRRETRRNATWYELSHDRLVEPVREANKAWLQQRETPFQHQAAIWEKENRPKGLLWHDETLEDTEKWAEVHKDELEYHEKDFLDACREAREVAEKEKRQTRRLRITRNIAAACAFLFIIAAGISLYAMRIAQTERKNKEAIAIHNKNLAEAAWKAERLAKEETEEKKSLLKQKDDLYKDLLKESKSKELALQEKDFALKKAVAAKNEAINNARIALGRQLANQAISMSTEQPDLALLLSLEANRIDKGPESKSSLLNTLWRSPPQLSQYLKGHDKAVWVTAANNRGDRLASADENGTVIIWNTRKGMPAGPVLQHPQGVIIVSLAFNPKKDNLLATIDHYGILRLWDTEMVKFSIVEDPEDFLASFEQVAFSPDGKILAAGKRDGSILLYDMSAFSFISGKLEHPRKLPGVIKEKTRALVFTADGSILASAHGQSFILWNTTTDKQLCPPLEQGHTDTIYGLAFSGDGKTLATCGEDRKIILWNVTDPSQPKLLQPLTGHTDAVKGVAFSPDDRVLYSAGGDRSVRMWDTSTGKQIGRPLTGHARAALSLSLINDGNFLATSGMDGSTILWDIYSPQRLGQPLFGKVVPVRKMAFSPDGRTLASGGEDGNVILWDTIRQQQDGAPLVSTTARGERRNDWVTSLVFDLKQKILYAGSTDGAIRVWDTEKHAEKGDPMKMDKDILSLALSHGGQFLASGDNDKNITLWDLSTRRKKGPPLSGHTKAIWSLAFNKSDAILASGSDDGSVRLWDVKSGRPKGNPLATCAGRVSSVAFHPQNDFLYVACADKIFRWDIGRSSPKPHLVYASKDGAKINQIDFSPNGSVLAASSSSKSSSTILFIDPVTGTKLFEPAAEPTGSHIWSVAFDRQGKTVALGTYGGYITLWNPRTGKRFGRYLEGHHREVQKMAISSDGTMLASSSDNNIIEIISPVNSNYYKSRELRPGEKVTALIFNPLSGSSQLFTASDFEKGRILSWDLGQKERKESNPIARATGYIHSLALSPDGSTLAAGTDKDGIFLWDLTTATRTKRQFPGTKDTYGNTEPVFGLSFSKDGRWLASGSKGKFVIWDVDTKDPLVTKQEKVTVQDNLIGLQFSPIDPVLAVPSDRGDIVLWDVSNPRKIRDKKDQKCLKGHTGMVTSLSFSPDGKTLASGSLDHSVRLWDTQSGQSLGPGFTRHKAPVNNVVFSRDNKEFYSGGEDGLIMQWDVDIERLHNNAISIAGRNMTGQEWSRYLPQQKYKITSPKPLLLETDLLRLKGERMAAAERYREIVNMTSESDDAGLLNSICWQGSIDGYADIVMNACDRAVSKATTPTDKDNYRDTRGLARARANRPRIKEAIEDFQAFVKWTKDNPQYYRPYGKLREMWIGELSEGRIPFDEKTLRRIRNESMQ